MSRADSPLRGRLIFLVGAQRSGTNWLQSMLATHPDVAPLPSETQLISVGVRLLENFVQNGAIEAWSTGRSFMDRSAFADAARDFCDAVLAGGPAALDESAAYILERSPNHAEHLDLVAELYPDAKVVHIIRDGRDVARSLIDQPWGTNDIGEAARRWRQAVSVTRAHAPAMAAYVEVRYEDLLADPGATYQKVLSGLALSASDAVVDAALIEARIPRNVNRFQPQVGVGKWRATWTPQQLAEFETEAGELLYAELGYERLTVDAAARTQHVASGPLQRVAERAKQLAGRRRVGSVEPPSQWRQQERAQRAAQDIVGLLARGQVGALEAHLSSDAEVRVVTTHDDTQARGRAGLHALAAATKTGGGWGRQVRGQVHFAFPMTVIVTTHEKDGVRTDRAVVTRMRDGQVTRLVYYCFATRPSSTDD